MTISNLAGFRICYASLYNIRACKFFGLNFAYFWCYSITNISIFQEIFSSQITDNQIFYFLYILFLCCFSYMIVCLKSNNFVNYKLIGGKGGVKSPFSCFNSKTLFRAMPKVTKCQSYMGFMYWPYILRIKKKTCGAY